MPPKSSESKSARLKGQVFELRWESSDPRNQPRIRALCLSFSTFTPTKMSSSVSEATSTKPLGARRTR